MSAPAIPAAAAPHFRISQDNCVSGAGHQSVCRSDYVPWGVSGRPAGAVPPAPADVLTTDHRYFNDHVSETRQVFERDGPTEKPVLRNDHALLRGTNFKPDRDLNKFQCYDTTHSLDYPAKVVVPRGTTTREPLKSYIPQGDRDKAAAPESDYRACFPPHDARAHKPQRAANAHQGGPPPIKGSSDALDFSTTHNDTFTGVSAPRVAALPAPTGTSVPRGDVGRAAAAARSVQQEAFPPHAPDGTHQAYDKDRVQATLLRTNFKQEDGVYKWNDYRSTMTDSYQSRGDGAPNLKFLPLHHRNHSDFPEGDYNADRNTERANMTTNRFFHGNAPDLRSRHGVVSGANRRTLSNVSFGEPRLNTEFYATSTATQFKPASVPYTYARHDYNTYSRVPLHYYENMRGDNTTYTHDFENPQQPKLVPNPIAVSSIKNSHILAPLGGSRHFSTEHTEQFPAKRRAPLAPIDPGRLQRSTVPLGTMATAH